MKATQRYVLVAVVGIICTLALFLIGSVIDVESCERIPGHPKDLKAKFGMSAVKQIEDIHYCSPSDLKISRVVRSRLVDSFNVVEGFPEGTGYSGLRFIRSREIGWPLRFASGAEETLRRGANLHIPKIDSIEQLELWPGTTYECVLNIPTRIDIVAMVANILFFSSLFWGICASVALFRRHCLRRHGRCEYCGYLTLHSRSTRCSECGYLIVR